MWGPCARKFASGVVWVLGLSGCASTLSHPLRAPGGGLFGELAVNMALPTGRTVFCHSVCPEVGRSGGALQLPTATLGTSRVYGRRFGVMVGLTALVRGEMGARGWTPALAGFAFFTWQGRYGSIGAGPDLRLSAAGFTLGAEVQPFGARGLRPRLGVYARWYFPFSPREPETGDAGLVNGVQPQRELGARLSIDRFFVQASWLSQTRGLFDHPQPVEGWMWSEGMVTLSLGMTLRSSPARRSTPPQR